MVLDHEQVEAAYDGRRRRRLLRPAASGTRGAAAGEAPTLQQVPEQTVLAALDVGAQREELARRRARQLRLQQAHHVDGGRVEHARVVEPLADLRVDRAALGVVRPVGPVLGVVAAVDVKGHHAVSDASDHLGVQPDAQAARRQRCLEHLKLRREDRIRLEALDAPLARDERCTAKRCSQQRLDQVAVGAGRREQVFDRLTTVEAEL